MQNTNISEEIENENLKRNLSLIKNKYIVISGKGGVGKSTVAVNLAYGLAKKNYQVGILDVDIHGPNIPKMLGVKKRNELFDLGHGIEPISVLPNLKIMSVAFLLQNEDTPIIWRGPLKYRIIKQFLGEVNWGNLDYLIIDSPPGTGDEPLSVCQLIGDVTGAIIVTTPQEVAILDARKSVVFAHQIKVPVVGIIENMSDLICPYCEKEITLFGKGGGKKAALDLEVPFLGSVPIEPAVVKAGDNGEPFIYFNKETFTAKAIAEIIDNIENLSKH